TGRIIFLDRGTDYVKENMVCLNSWGLIGKVFEVGKDFSKCICLNDLNSRVPAKVERTQEQGLVYGTINGIRLEMKYLNKHSAAQTGDRIITSGLGEVYPPGILIGTISELRTDANYKIAVILPAVDFLKLEEILLLGKNAK
ncbi:MAG: rod shape-determining protein MreC, partial [Candidatus Omnitrophica bacterium]|nr:rod shape-determining protein MreC [Candidatus Omnitrophota bacterium]